MIKKRLIDDVEVIQDSFYVAGFCINICVYVCFVEEVILADDENENDYDGMNCSFLCSCAYMNVIFKNIY